MVVPPRNQPWRRIRLESHPAIRPSYTITSELSSGYPDADIAHVHVDENEFNGPG